MEKAPPWAGEIVAKIFVALAVTDSVWKGDRSRGQQNRRDFKRIVAKGC